MKLVKPASLMEKLDLLETRITALTSPLTDEEVAQLVSEAQQQFHSFGGERKGDGSNPITHWNEGQPAIFAMGVKIEDVIRWASARADTVRRQRPLP